MNIDPGGNELLEKNMAFLGRIRPGLAAALKSLGPSSSQLVRTEDGDWDVEFRGVRLYGAGAKATAKQQLDEDGRWSRLLTSRPGKQSTDKLAGILLKNLYERAEANGVQFESEPTREDCHFVAVMGVGLAAHLEQIIVDLRCKYLILVEPNLEFLLHSLSVFDWEAFTAWAEERGVSLHWIFSDRDLLIADSLRAIIRGNNPVQVDGMWLFVHYRNAAMEAARTRFLAEAGMVLTGLGWVDDEILMVRNSHVNLRDGKAMMIRPSSTVRNWPAFIVGSGPSIDKDLDAIAENADRALVIACGTGLGPLLKRGIRPDFYVEMENVPASYTFLEMLVREHSLAGITLFATTTIDPRIAPLFDSSIWFVREGLASYPVFSQGPEYDVPYINPTVTNTGLAFAMAMGFREFYFFGIDLGSKDPARHHSRHTPYMEGTLPFENKLKTKMPGNFGGEVYSDHVFLWAHDSFQKVIALKGAGRRFFNCSDGALIKGAIPKLSRAIKLPQGNVPKAQLLQELVGSCSPYGADNFSRAWSAKRHFEELAEMRDRLIEFCAEQEVEREPLRYLNNIVGHLVQARPTKASHHYFRGTLMMAFLSGIHLVNRVCDAQVEEVCAILHDETTKLIHAIHDHVRQELLCLAEEPA